MTIAQKLQHLTGLMSKAKVARRAGVNPLTLDKALDGTQTPTIDTCRKLASALEVDAGWLMDESKGLPPVRVEQHGAAA